MRDAPQEEYDAIFGCPVLFEQPRTFIAFESAFLNWNYPSVTFLHQARTRHVEALLKSCRATQAGLQVRKILEKISPMRSMSYKSQTSLRCRGRLCIAKLKQEGVSFQELVEEVRKDKALHYLNAGRYSLSEIAFLPVFRASAFQPGVQTLDRQSQPSFGGRIARIMHRYGNLP